MERILLIGGAGFIGKKLALELKKSKKAKIFVLGRSDLKKKDKISGVTYYQHDLTSGKFKFKDALLKKDVAVIMTQPAEKVINNIVNGLKKNKDLKKIVFVSSLLVYPSSKSAQDERTKPKPESLYERGKINEENKISKFARESGIKLSIVRLSNVYGNINNKRIIGFIFSAALNNTPLKINGDGEQKKDFIYIKDAVQFLKFIIFYDQNKNKEIFNICTKKPTSINEVVKIISKITNKRIKVIHGPPIVEKKIIFGDNKKILTLSKIELKYDLLSGLRESFESSR